MSAREVRSARSLLKDYLIIGILWLLAFVAGSQVLIIAPILPQISDQLIVSESLLGTLIAAYAVAVGIFALITGPISDRIGRRRILLIGNMIMAVALVLHWVTWDFASLFAVRMFAGIAGGILNGASVAYVSDYFPTEKRGWANGWVASGGAAGLIAGVPIGTMMAEQYGFRWPFVAFGGILFGTFVLLLLYVPQPDVQLTDELTIRSALHRYAVLLKKRECLAATVVFVVMFAGNSLYITYLPTWLVETRGIQGGAVGTMFFFGGVGTVIAAPYAGTLSDRLGRKPIIIAASVSLAIAIFGTPYLIRSTWIAYGLFFLVMGLFTARGTPFQTLLTEMVSSDRRGSFLNLSIGMGQIGSGIGGGLAGALYSGAGYEGTTTITAIAMLVTGLLVWVSLPETVLKSR